jgi:hypothetical protein
MYTYIAHQWCTEFQILFKVFTCRFVSSIKKTGLHVHGALFFRSQELYAYLIACVQKSSSHAWKNISRHLQINCSYLQLGRALLSSKISLTRFWCWGSLGVTVLARIEVLLLNPVSVVLRSALTRIVYFLSLAFFVHWDVGSLRCSSAWLYDYGRRHHLFQQLLFATKVVLRYWHGCLPRSPSGWSYRKDPLDSAQLSNTNFYLFCINKACDFPKKITPFFININIFCCCNDCWWYA